MQDRQVFGGFKPPATPPHLNVSQSIPSPPLPGFVAVGQTLYVRDMGDIYFIRSTKFAINCSHCENIKDLIFYVFL